MSGSARQRDDSSRVERILREEAQSALDRPAPDAADPALRGRSVLPVSSLLMLVTVLAGLVIAAVVAATSGSWLLLALAVIVLLSSLATMVLFTVRATGQTEKPSAERVAALDAEGVDDPEAAVNQAIDRERARPAPGQPARSS